MNKCIVVSDSFKGTLSSTEICDIALEEIGRVFPNCATRAIPVADGGEGTVDCFIRAIGAERVLAEVSGAYGERITAAYARKGESAIIEMAAAAGLPSVGDRRDPSRTTTFGVGELIAHAVDSGCRRIYLGLGGSATNDGGCGCAAALGVRFYDGAGQVFVPVGGTLENIRRVDISAAAARLRDVELTAMCDVDNPLFGEKGAAYTYAPQKGADRTMVERLDKGLRQLGDIIDSQLRPGISALAGAGAAGGMGAGVTAFLGGTLRSGIETVLELTEFDALLEGAELVISGEGRVDGQSMQGKVVSGVAAHTSKKGVPLVVVAGCTGEGAENVYSAGVDAVFTTNRGSLPFEQLKPRAAEDYRRTLADILRLMEITEKFT